MLHNATGKRVFILGAGSSIGHLKGEYPGISNIFAFAKRLLITVDSLSARSPVERYQRLYEFIRENFGQSILDQSAAIDIEELLTFVETTLERQEDGDLLQVNKLIKEIIRAVLIEQPKTLNTEDGEYHRFNSMLDVSDSIISFNWDLLLDNILSEQLNQFYWGRADTEQKVLCQYKNFVENFAVRKTNLLSSVNDSGYKPEVQFPYTGKEASVPMYLKAHGSVDWFACSNSACRASTALFMVDDPSEKYFCSECHEPMMNILIPPVLNKRIYSFPAIRRIWNTAAKELALAEEVVLWGYSLPPTDFYSKWLLRQARTGNLKRLTIINPAVVNNPRPGDSTKVTLGRAYVRRIYDIYRGVVEKDGLSLYENMHDYSFDQELREKYGGLFGGLKDPYDSI